MADQWGTSDAIVKPKTVEEFGTNDEVAQHGALRRGWNKMTQSVGLTSDLATGDYKGAASRLAEISDYQQKNPGTPEGKKLIDAWNKGDGISGGLSEVGGAIAKDWDESKGALAKLRSVGRNVSAMGQGVLEQTPNMVAPMSGMLAGGAAGSLVYPVVGTAVGGWAGASLGNTAVEGGGMTQEALQKAGINPADKAATEAYLKENGDSLLTKAGVKGSIIGAVDTLTAGLGHAVLTAPAKAAAGRAITAMGIDVADKAAVKAASSEIAARMAADPVYLAATSGVKNVARNASVAALEPGGEFAGEYVGQGAATGEWDTKNAFLEAASSIGQGAATFAGQKLYAGMSAPFGAGDAIAAPATTPPVAPPGPDLSLDPNTQLAAVQSEEMGAPNVAQTTPPATPVPPVAPATVPPAGTGAGAVDGGIDWEAAANMFNRPPASGTGGVDAANVLQAAPVAPSVQMGINPAAGVISAVAAQAVDEGRTQEIQLNQANAQDQAAYEQAMAAQEQQAAEMSTANNPITSGKIAEAKMPPADLEATVYPSPQVLEMFTGTQAEDILNGEYAPFSSPEAAQRRAKMEGKLWDVAPVFDGWVVRKKEFINVSDSNGVQPAPTASSGNDGNNAGAGVESGATDGNGVGADAPGRADDAVGESRQLPGGADDAAVISELNEALAPVNIAQAATENIANVQNTAPEPTGAQAKAAPVEAGATAAGDAAPAADVPGAGTAPVESAGVGKYALPAIRHGDEWSGKEGPGFQPNLRQKLVMDATRQALDEGKTFSRELESRVSQILNVPDDVLSQNKSNVEGGDFAYDVYHARKAVEASKNHAQSKFLADEMKLKVGDSIGTIMTSDGKRNTSVVIISVSDDGLSATIEGKRGPAKVSGQVGVDRLKESIENAYKAGHRKETYQDFVNRNQVANGVSQPAQPGTPGEGAGVSQPTQEANPNQKALDRIAKGTAYFGTNLKAAKFIADNGLKDTHEWVKTGASRFEVREKATTQEALQVPSERETRIASALANGGHVVGADLRDRTGMRLMGLTPEELKTIPADKVRAKPSAEAARTNSTTKGNEDGTQAAQAQPQQTQPEAGANTSIPEPAAGEGVAGPTEAVEKPSLKKAQAKRVADKQEEAPTVESVAKAIQQKVASNRRKYREKSRKEREAKGYAPNSTPESEQADYDEEISGQPSEMHQRSAAALIGSDPRPLIEMFVHGQYEASKEVFKEITGVRIRGLSAVDKKAALYKWANWTPEQIAQAEQSATDKEAARAEKFKQDDLKSDVLGAWLALDNLRVGETKVNGTETGQEFVIRTIASGFDKAHSQKKGVAPIYGFTDGKSFTTLKNGALTKFVKAAIAFGGLDKAMEYVNPPKPQAPAGFVVRDIKTADAPAETPMVKAMNDLAEVRQRIADQGQVVDDRLLSRERQLRALVKELESDGQNDELDAEMQTYEAKASGKDITAEIESAVRRLRDAKASGRQDTIDLVESQIRALRQETKAPEAQTNNAPAATETVAVKANTVFTEDAAAAARARLKAKLSRLNTGVDPEMLMDGIILSGYHIEKGARTFVAYARAMIDDLGDGVKPYLKSWYMASKYDPRMAGMDGLDDAATMDAVNLDKLEAPETEKPNQEGRGTLTAALTAEILSGKMPKDNPALKKLVEAFDGKPADPSRMKSAQEALEAAIVNVSRQIVAKNEGPRTTFDVLLRLYESQPNLNIRTSTSIANQAYSTPAPLAYLGSVLADVTPKTTMYEPAAGNGMLTINALPGNVTVNELEAGRIDSLKSQGFKQVLEGDALKADVPAKSQDRVVTNPPFGSIKDSKGEATKISVDGYKIGQIDHLIAARALETMKDDGKATLIIGANKVSGGLNTDDRIFFNWLYGNYNVTSHFEVEGDLYQRQGAGWPVRVITINGRAKSDRVSPVAGTIQRAQNWEQVYEQFTASLDSSRAEPKQGAVTSAGGTSTGQAGAQPVRGSSVKPDSKDGGRGQAGSPVSTGNVSGASAGNGADSSKPVADKLGGPDSGQRLNAESVESNRLDPSGDAVVSAPAKPAGAAGATALSSAENQFQVTYEPRSARKDGGVLIPVNMKDPTQDALSRLEDAVGNIDEYAAKQLGYKSVEQLHDALMGLQVDSVASAIYQIEQGKGVVIADQTGIGKGRQAAAVIRWAERSGYIPVFVSVKPSLFTDMFGDLHDIGSDNIAPFILNKDESIKGPGDTKLFANKALTHKRNIENIRDTGKLPDGSNAIFMTYSQINTDNVQRQMLTALADRAVFILDESHNAGGQSNTGEFMISLLEGAKGVTYLSATYAKRPDNMPLYFKTDIGQAAADNEGLMQAMASGGLPLQTVVSNNLVKAGQMFRRERSYDGVSIETIVDTEHRTEHEKLSDETTRALRAIVSADRMFHHVFVKQMNEDAKSQGAAVIDNAGNQAQAGVDHTQFSSVVHNFVKQMLLGLKAQRAADEAIAALKDNRKPIIAVENTMGSFLEAYAKDNMVTQGGSLGSFDYRTVLSRALARTLFITEVTPTGDKVKREIKLSELDAETRAAYDNAQQVIDGLKLDIPVSPIDWIRNEIRKAGFTVAEITGRKLAVDYSEPGKATLGSIDALEQTDKVRTTQLFNSGRLDALILNVAGSTGISLHASEKFTDQRQRHMIVAQAAGDINIFMQMLGRIHRTGQVVLPGYGILSVDLPTEKRPTAVLSGKMKSLNANTSSNTDSATSIKTVDMFNKYGDQVVAQYLQDNYQLARDLGVEDIIGGDDATEDLAQKATGRLALQPIAVQNSFYDEVEGQYSAMMEYLNKTNQNDLEPRTFDFDAQEIRSEVLFDGPNKETPFGEDAIYGEYSIKAQGKAMTPAEIREAMTTNLAGKNADMHMQAALAPLVKQFDDYIKTLEGPSRDSANAARAAGQAFMVNHSIGDTFRVDINGDSFNAVVTNIRNTHKANGNPFSLSKIQVTIALNGALRSISVPASQFQKIEVSSIGRGYTVEQLFKEQPANQRETAKIVTGNLLAAYGELQGVRGTIITFTKQDGTTEQGILLPKAFDYSRNTRGDYRLATGADALNFLQKSENKDIGRFGIQSRDGIVRVLPAGQGIAVLVPKSKLKGGKFFLDKGLIDVLGDFVTSGSAMKATTYDQGEAIKALDLLMKKNALYAIPSMAEEARALSSPPDPAAFSRPTFSRGAQSQANESVERLATGIASHWKNAPKVVVAFDMNDPEIHEDVRKEDQRQRSGGATGTPEGFYYKGTVYLMSSKLGTPNDIARVLFHEALGHYGLRGTFGKALRPILRDVAMLRRAEVDAKIKQYGLKGIKLSDRLIAAEEVLAELAQTRPDIGFVKRAIAAVRTWLRQNVPGFASLRLSDAELIRNYILPARQFVENGGGPKGGVRVEPTFSRGTNDPMTNNDVVGNQGGRSADDTTPGAAKQDAQKRVDSISEFQGLRTEFGEAVKRAVVDGYASYVDYNNSLKNDPFVDVFGENTSDIQIKSFDDWLINKDGPINIPKIEQDTGSDWTPEHVALIADIIQLRDVIGKSANGMVFDLLPTGLKTEDKAYEDSGSYGMRNEILDAAIHDLHEPVQDANGKSKGFTRESTSLSINKKRIEYGEKELGNTVISHKTIADRFTKKPMLLLKTASDSVKYIRDNEAAIEWEFGKMLRDVVDINAKYDEKVKAEERAKTPEGRRATFRLIKPNESTAPDSGGAMFSRTIGETLTTAANNFVVPDVGKKFGNRLADFRGIALQALGRRQLVDIYGKDLPQLTAYSDMVAQMDADKNEAGAEADALATEWGKLDESPMGGLAKHPGMERKLAELMHDATLAQIDPDKEFVAGDDVDQYKALRDGFEQLSPKAQAAYRKARGMYADHNEKVRQAIRERIERSELSPAKRKALLERMDGEFFQKVKGVYFPLARFGQYLTIVKDSEGTVLNVSRSETLNEADETRKILLKEYPASGGFTVGKVLKEKEFNAARDGVGRGFMADLFETLEKTEAGEELIDSISQLYLAALPDLSWAKHGIHRKGTPGFSQDARRAFAQNMFHGARYLAKLRYADQLQTHLDDMQEHIGAKSADDGFDSVKAQQVADEMVKRHDSMMNPESHPISTALTSFGFVFHLGLSPASAMVNLSQTALVALPVMGAKWGFGKSSAALLTASKQAASNRNDISKVLKGDELRAYNEAVRSGVIDVTMAHDLAGIAQGEDSKVAAKVRPVMKWASFLFHHAEKFNRQVTFVAAYRLAREAGAEHSKAYADAVKATYDGHFDYSASNRARLLQGNWQKVILLFKQYAQNMIYTLSRQAYQAVKAGTPQERKEARKALSGLLVAHAMAAGVLGLPVVGMLLSAASMVGGDDDEPWDAKVALQNMLADTLGQKPAEVIAHGLSRLTPWDISGRVGLDKLLLPDIQEGLSGTPAAQAMLASAAGPVAGIGVNMVKGLAEIGDGQYQRGFESMLPSALRGPLKAYRFAAEGNIDKTGVPINDEVSAAGIAGQALGLSPSETRLAQEGKSAIYSADRAVRARRLDLMRAYSMASIDSDIEGMAETREKITRFNEKNPTSRIMPMHLMASVRARKKRIEESKQGVYLPKKRQDAMEAGRFAVVD